MLPPPRNFKPARRFSWRRRNRVTIICSIVITFFLIVFIENSWDEPYDFASSPYNHNHYSYPDSESVADAGHGTTTSEDKVVERPAVPGASVPELKAEDDPEGLTHEKLDEYTAKQEEEHLGVKEPVAEIKEETSKETVTTSPPESPPTKPEPGLDETTVGDGASTNAGSSGPTEEKLELHAVNPPNEEASKVVLEEVKVHWSPVPEHFPVPEEEIVQLPSGTPKKIPKIQYDFDSEPQDIRTTRLQRLKRVKTEIERAWGGYKKFAWMHDELSPLSTKYRDPFCGWAATLVDSLDTLWIAGLRDDFDQAAKAVKDIDFTFTDRNEIPVFETTIRYLGGLLAAFDVSGGHKGAYKILLEKAEELAEILMGIFDTPNRMPVLYYNWKPEHASQPHRGAQVGIAELGTLSMEFTRLAQLTGTHKYYDAVDRITNALVEMQATQKIAIPGLFPEGIDVSGCNRTATTLRNSLSKAAQEQLDSENILEEPVGYVPKSSSTTSSSGESLDTEDSGSGPSEHESGSQLRRRDTTGLETGGDTVETPSARLDEDSSTTPAASDDEVKRQAPFAADGSTTAWDCVPQGLVPSGFGFATFHMGGGQDSAYEYFPKQWLLLGGLEPKYQKLYEDSVKAINEWLLFRPMASEGWDVLFPAKVSVTGEPGEPFGASYEVTHLTCFIGGMYGLGGRIFGREEDVELAKKLTDGCVWAYQTMPSGLMPENAHVVPCPTLEKCEFNQTEWWDQLDQSKEWREKEIAKWEAAGEEETQATLDPPVTVDPESPAYAETENKRAEGAQTVEKDESQGGDATEAETSTGASSGSLRKRGVIPIEAKTPPADDDDDDDVGSELPASLRKKLGLDVEEEAPADNEQDEEAPPTIPQAVWPDRIAVKQAKPPSHEEFVKQKIKDLGLQPGYTDIQSRNYILRYVTPTFNSRPCLPWSRSKH